MLFPSARRAAASCIPSAGGGRRDNSTSFICKMGPALAPWGGYEGLAVNACRVTREGLEFTRLGLPMSTGLFGKVVRGITVSNCWPFYGRKLVK